jgi:hypothetical protein
MTPTTPNPRHCLIDKQLTLNFWVLGGLTDETAAELIAQSSERQEQAYQPVQNAFDALIDELNQYQQDFQDFQNTSQRK